MMAERLPETCRVVIPIKLEISASVGFIHKKSEGKRPLGRHRRRWEDNIKMDLEEVGYAGMDWIDLAQDRDRWRALVNAAMNIRV